MTSATGRPLRALGLLALVMALWFAGRVPGLSARYEAAIRAMRTTELPGLALPFAKAAGTTPAVPRVIQPARMKTLPPGPRRAVRLLRSPSPLPSPTSLGETGVVSTPSALHVVHAAADAAALPDPAYAFAAQAYVRLAAGDRRAADRLFGAAIAAAEVGAPNLATWRRERQRLNRHWSAEAYALFRDAGAVGVAASPVLGGGQSGAGAAWTIDPLARRPVAIIGRIYAAHVAASGIDGDTAQAAIGVRWQLRPGVGIAAERLIAIGRATSADWNLRVAAGGERQLGHIGLDAYGEAGVRGNGDVYAGGQARAALPLGTAIGLRFSGGPGVWGSVQAAATTASRLDLGVGVTGRLPAGVAVSADWRWRVAGNAAPASGPAVTVSMGF